MMARSIIILGPRKMALHRLSRKAVESYLRVLFTLKAATSKAI